MLQEQIIWVWVHPAQFTAMKAKGQVENLRLYRKDCEGEDLWVTSHGQRVVISKHLPEEGLFLHGSKAVTAAEKTEAGIERRREALRLYREKHPQ